MWKAVKRNWWNLNGLWRVIGIPRRQNTEIPRKQNPIESSCRMMSHMGIQSKELNSTFISPGMVLSKTEKLKKENLNPGEAESIMDCEIQSSVEIGDKFQWVRIALPQNPRKKWQAETKGTSDSGNCPEKSVDTSTISNKESSSQTNGKSVEKHQKDKN